MRSEPVNDGLWAYERVDGRYLRKQAARVEWAPRGMTVVFPPRKTRLMGVFLYTVMFEMCIYIREDNKVHPALFTTIIHV